MEESNFIWEAIDEDLKKNPELKIHTRFPPEPNGYLHIGHTKALVIDFTTALRYGGLCNLRMDDTNPAKEDTEFVDAIKEDIHWLGFDWDDRFYYGSDYFETTYQLAEKLILSGDAYVCELSPEEFREYRGDLTHPAVSPYRDRPMEENLDLFRRMRAGEFPEGKYVLRARIDLSSGNFNMRDPVLYRIRYIDHHRQGTKWCIFPMYDFAHPIQDAIEGVTHSLCSLEYEDHRPLYNWVIDHVELPARPRQIEFARLNVTNTVLSKRFLRYLVEEGLVDGWDDPRMPTLCGLRRRGYPAAAILDFIGRVGVAKTNSLVDIALLEHCVRENLNEHATRRIAVFDPVKVTVTNYPEDKVEYFDIPNNPREEAAGVRSLPFTRELYVEREDIAIDPPAKFFRMKPGGEVRLMGAYIVKVNEIQTDSAGNVTGVLCEADLETGNGMPADGRKVKGTIHWLSAKESSVTDAVNYDHLFTEEDMNAVDSEEYANYLNPASKVEISGVRIEKALEDAAIGEAFQFVRKGYYTRDPKNPTVFHSIVALKDNKKF